MSSDTLSPLARTTLHRSPYLTPTQRTVLGRIENTPQRSTVKISRLLEDRRSFSMDKENQPKSPSDRSKLSFDTVKFQETKTNETFGHFEFTQTTSGLSAREQSFSFGSVTEQRFRFGSESFGSGNAGKEFESSGFFKAAMEVSREGACTPVGHPLRRMKSVASWTLAQLSDDSPSSVTPQKNMEDLSCDSGYPPSSHKPSSPVLHDETTVFEPPTVPGHDLDTDVEFETLHDLDEEFENDNFERCSKYEIISTDSPNIISRGSSARTVTSKNLVFGAPIAETEQSTSFNRNPSARALNFDEAFEFTSPASIRPRTQSNVSVKKTLKFTDTPKKNVLCHEKSDSSIGTMSNCSPVSRNRMRLFTSESTNSVESGFASEADEVFLFDAVDSDSYNSPKMANFNELLSGQIKDTLLPLAEETMDLSEGTPNRTLGRSMSLTTDAMDKVRLSLFKSRLASPESRRGFKRPDAAAVDGHTKRRRSERERPALQRALSDNSASIMTALARSASEPDLIGDFSLPCALPVTGGRHSDLKSISCDTLAALLRGEYRDTVADYQVIDCRYPYEFAGGHVQGARNLYTPQHVLQLLTGPREQRDAADAGRRSILVFHCEFSIERGPKLSRFLRTTDRAANKDSYPALRYPEIYLLHDGYSAFHRAHPEHCSPAGYTPMLDPAFKMELAKHRSSAVPLSKSMSVDGVRKSRSRLLM